MQKIKRLWQLVLSKLPWRKTGVTPPIGGPAPQPQPQPPTAQPVPTATTSGPKVWHPGRTIAIGIGLCATLTLLLVACLPDEVKGWFAWLVSATVIFGTVFVFGLAPVEIQHTAVPLFFGRRIKWFILGEGWNWLLPRPIMDARIVDMRERVLRIGEKFGKDQVEDLVAATIEEGDPDNPDKKSRKKTGHVRLVEMVSRVTILWLVEDSDKFLNIGEAKIEGALIDLAVKTLREKAARINDIDFIQSAGKFEKAILKAILDDKDASKIIPKGEPDTRERIIDIYGIKVRRVIIPKITHRDPATVKAYESVVMEKRQKQAEDIEVSFVMESIQKLVGVGLTAEQAVFTIQAERGKSRRQELIIRAGDGVSDIVKGAAVIQQGGGLFAPPTPTRSQGEGLEPLDAP